VTEKDGPGDDEERETLAGETSAPRDAGTAPEFDDLESLPARRPPRQTPQPKRPPPPAPTEPDPPPTVAERPSTETPTREIDVEREMPTIVGSFSPTTSGATSPPDPNEAETVVEGGKPEPSGPGGAEGTQGTEATGRTEGRPWKSPLSKAASRTARDPVVGSAALRGTQPYAPHAAGGLAEGQLLADRYELVERLGKGGMGEVWKARHILLQGLRAIKVIKASISRDATFRQRFLKEGQTMMRVKHPGVVEVTDLDETRQNRELFMVMEYLKGRTIYDAIRSEEKPLAADVRGAARVLREVALGMQRIHDERIVHKDLKSDNVLLVVGDDGLEHPKVIDFGLAKSLGDADAPPDHGDASSPPAYDPDLHTTLSGTLAYMAPEQFRSEPSSFQSDIYAFGVMAFEVFCRGEFPLPRGPLTHYMDLHQKAARPDLLAKKRPDLDPRLAAILDPCLATDRAARPASFAQIAADLQYWLDTPEREARRRKRVYAAAAATALVAAAVWGIFFSGKTTASLGNPKVSSGDLAFVFDGNTAHVPAAALSSLVITTDIKGTPGVPVLEIDGREHPAKSELNHEQLTFTADVHELADGNHSLSVRAGANAAAVAITLDVDRQPPSVGEVTVTGSVATPTGLFTRGDSPEVGVHLDEPAAHIAAVYAVTKDGKRAPGEMDRASGLWVVKGTAGWATNDGRVEFDVVVRDLAGNETKRHMAYIWDYTSPKPQFPDVFTCMFGMHPKSAAHEGLFVRSPDGATLRVVVDKPCDVIATFGGLPEVTKHADAAGEVEIAVPTVPEGGLATTVVVRDLAGNEAKRAFPVELLDDVVQLMTADQKQELAIDNDPARRSQAYVVVVGTYPIGDDLELWSEPVRAADGAEITGGARRPLKLNRVRVDDGGKTHVFVVSPGTFEDGEYDLTASLPTRPQVEPLRVIADSAAPVVESVRVEDAVTHRPVAEGAYALHPDVVVTAVVSDLSLRRVELDKARPAEKVVPGRGTYTFRRHLDAEGLTTMTLAVGDAAGHHFERSVSVLADWTTPEITALESPRDGSSYTDVKEVEFKGVCSEAPYTLLVEGLPGDPLKAEIRTTEFAQKFLLHATDGPAAVSVVAVDPAGHRSAPKTITITVVHKSTELPDEITWSGDVKVPMEKVMPGDVVIGGRVRAVGLVFLDRTEVTNSQYREFLAATAGRHGDWCHPDEPKGWDHTPAAATWKDPKWNADDLPVVNVSYWDAYAFAKWSGRRLPTEAEWVKAAAKSKSPAETELRSWPPFAPGEEWRDGVVVTSDWAKGPVSALSGGDVSPVGCLHMGGNVAEWVDLPEPVDGSPAGTRGGSWFFSRRAADVRNTPAKAFDRSFRANTIGLRCAVDASRVQP
jgi:tRNA A-37 threonylcarbamoyl transferase component Bud32